MRPAEFRAYMDPRHMRATCILDMIDASREGCRVGSCVRLRLLLACARSLSSSFFCYCCGHAKTESQSTSAASWAALNVHLIQPTNHTSHCATSVHTLDRLPMLQLQIFAVLHVCLQTGPLLSRPSHQQASSVEAFRIAIIRLQRVQQAAIAMEFCIAT